jgi:putative addiction module killer protein
MDVQQTEIFRNWFNALKDRRARARILMRIDRAENGNFGDHKSVGGGVSEMRIDYGVGYRIYYTLRGTQLVILLAGGDKSSQAQNIRTAQQLVRQL